MPCSAESFITRIHLSESWLSKWRSISSRKQNATLSSLQSKPTFFGTKKSFPSSSQQLECSFWGMFLLFLALGSVLRMARWKDFADDKPQSYQAVAIYPGIILCEWLTGKTQGDLVTGKGCHLFIYFPPQVTNSKNRQPFGNRSTREQEEFC